MLDVDEFEVRHALVAGDDRDCANAEDVLPKVHGQVQVADAVQEDFICLDGQKTVK